jgi:hypothetical protein
MSLRYKNPDDHLYYNALFSNDTDVQRNAFFTETRTSPILLNPSLYHLALIRFTIPTFAIPLFVWPTLANGTTPNNNYWSFTFEYAGVIRRKFVTYLNWSNSVIPSVYSYQNFIDACNICLNECYLQMVADAPGFPALAHNPPYIIYDPATQILSLVAETSYLCNDPLSIGIKIYSNFLLNQFFDPVPNIMIATNSVDGRDSLFVIEPTGNNNSTTNNPIGLYPANNAYSMSSQYEILNNWSSLKSLIVTSSNLRTKEEYVQTRTTINSDSTLQIITDFEPSRDYPGYSRAWQQYNADIYRYIDLQSTEPLRTIDLQIFWTDLQGKIYPLLINPQTYFTIKLLFTQKDSIH